jgi:hypothetical protein
MTTIDEKVMPQLTIKVNDISSYDIFSWLNVNPNSYDDSDFSSVYFDGYGEPLDASDCGEDIELQAFGHKNEVRFSADSYRSLHSL